MSKKCVAFSKSKLGLETADNRKSFYAGWDAALAEQAEQELVAYLCNGTCYKVQKLVGDVMICGLPDELIGQWVALVDATDGKHIKAAAVIRARGEA